MEFLDILPYAEKGFCNGTKKYGENALFYNTYHKPWYTTRLSKSWHFFDVY